jgi:hypothetical protein
MITKTVYTSILGREFSTAEAAMADEDRLPRIIDTYKGDVKKIENFRKMVKKSLAGKLDPKDRADAQRFLALKNEEKGGNFMQLVYAQRAVAEYKRLLALVREERFARGQKQP